MSKWPHRELQLQQLQLLLSLPQPPDLLVHGPCCTGKTSIVRWVFTMHLVPPVFLRPLCLSTAHTSDRINHLQQLSALTALVIYPIAGMLSRVANMRTSAAAEA
jgi:hypothetical protein